jgi:hypothetical protein
VTNVGYATLSVIPSAKGFGKALAGDVDPQLEETGKSSGSKFGKFLAGGAVAAAGLVIAGATAVLKTGFQEAMDASAGTAQLVAGIKSTGNAANVSVDGLNDLASSIQGVSGQTDDSIVASEKLLLTFTNIKNSGPDKIFDQATKATADMAAKMGGDAASNAVLLGKALNDPVKGISALTRVGVSFTKGQKDQIDAMVKSGDTIGAQKVILGELNKEFGGAAEAAGKSLPGQLEIAKRGFEDVSQSIAEKLIPMVVPALKKISDVVVKQVLPAVDRFIGGFKDGTGAGGKLRDILEKVGGALKIVGTFIRNNTQWLVPLVGAVLGFVAAIRVIMALQKAWIVVQTALNIVMSANPIGLIVIAIAALVTGIVLFFTKTEIGRKIWAALVTGFKVGWGWIKKAFSAGVSFVTEWLGKAWEFIRKVWSFSPLGLIVKNWDKILDFFKSIPGKLKAGFSRVVEFITAPYKAAFNLIAGFWNKTVGKLSFKAPSWVPGIGGKGWDVPDIPMLAKGGRIIQSGVAIVGEQGPEMVELPKGATVHPNGTAPRGGTVTNNFNIYEQSNPQAVAMAVARRYGRVVA